MVRPGVPARRSPRSWDRKSCRSGPASATIRSGRGRSSGAARRPTSPSTGRQNPYRGCAWDAATATPPTPRVPGPGRLVRVPLGRLREDGRRAGDAEEAPLRGAARRARGPRYRTDPYQPGESASRATRRFLEIAAEVRGLRIAITTKGSLVLRDCDLLKKLAARGRSRSACRSSRRTRTSCDGSSRGPRAAVRIEVLRRLVTEGIDAGLAIAPVLPA